MKQLHPNWTSRLVQFGAASLDCLDRNGSVPGAFMLSSISKDGSFGWMARGGALEVFAAQSGQRMAVWSFGAALKDTSTLITAVVEYSYDDAPRLLVGTTSSSTQAGLLCVFDIRTSKVIKAIEIPYKITAIEPVTSVGADQAPAQVLSEHLRCFCGVLAVGTHNGHIYMIDLNLDDEADSSDEVRPNSVLFLDPRVRDVASRRFSAISKRRHLCLELDDESHQRGYYYLRKPDSSVLKTYLADELCVSSLLYMRQTASLVVGFNFGCFQLWGLYTPVLEYTSRLVEDLSPITHFAYQEPENDPRNFVYIWVARGPLPMEPVDDQTASMSLFQLGYGKKVWHEGLGHVYEDLQSVGPRFEHYLTTNPYNSGDEDCAGSRVVCCYTIQDPNYIVPERTETEDSFDDGSGGPDLSLCAFVWEGAPRDQHARSRYHLAVFDMNRWYHAQMPHILRYSGLNHQTCPFLAFYSLDAISEACSPDNIMTLHVSSSTLARYQSCVVPAPEHHLYPSSLAFEAAAVTEGGLILARFLGQQRQVVADLLRGGPGLLVEPATSYVMCLMAGLLPRAAESAPTATVPAGEKRAALLGVILDHNQVSFLTACVHAWSEGEFTSAGCTLRFLLDWVWARVGTIKESMDRLCVTLYDWSGVPLDTAGLTLLHQHQVALQQIGLVMTTMLNVAVPSTHQGRADLETKVMVVQLIDAHLSVLIWCYMENFLPEVGEDEAPSDNRYGFPHSQLKGYFTQRRQEISRLNSELRGTELLMIDGVLEQAGTALLELWEKDGGAGTYPPPSLHAVLNMFLLESIPLDVKHSIFFYLLCDLMYLTPEETTERFEEKMHHFAATFSLPFATIRLVQGFWHLDRKEFEEAMFFLLDPIIRSELLPWQHTRIVKALLYQGHHKMALKYIRVKKPPMVTPEDVKLRLTVLLANGLTAEAFEYQRTCRDQGNMEDLLSHLFLGCQQTRTMDQLLQLPLSSDEERHLVSHMKTTTEPHAAEVLVLHYLQRARVIEALSLNAKIKHSTLNDVDTVGRERSLARQAIVDCYHRILPRAQRKLAFGADTALKRGASTRREVTRPVPLSTFVNRAKRSQAVSHATLISTVLEKVREVKDYDQEPQPSTSESTEPMSPADRHPGPFTCTPITPRTRSRIGETTEVVYPNVRYQEASPQAPSVLSPQRRPYGSPFSTTLQETFQPTNFSTSSRRLSSRVTNAAALSLLRTPPVRRKTPTSARLSAPHSASTPHSILKVRHSALRTASPLTAKSAKFSEQSVETMLYRKLNMDLAAADTLSMSTIKTTLSSTVSTSAQNTPKQLRFSVPASPESTPSERSTTPSPQPPSPSVATADVSPMRSARDRSPTPERNSPKASPKMDVLRVRQTRFATEDDDMDMETEDDNVKVTFQSNQVHQDIVMEDVDTAEEEAAELEVQGGRGDYAPDSVARPARHCHFEEQDEDDVIEDVPVSQEVAPVRIVNSSYEEMSSEDEDEYAEPASNGTDEPDVSIHQHFEEQETEEEDAPLVEKRVVTPHFEEQQEEDYVEKKAPLVKKYYEEQESEAEVNEASGDEEGQVAGAVSREANIEITVTKSVSRTRTTAITQNKAQPMDTQPTESELFSEQLDICDSGRVRRQLGDSNTLISNAIGSSDSKGALATSYSSSVNTMQTRTSISLSDVLGTVTHIPIFSQSEHDHEESDTEPLELRLDQEEEEEEERPHHPPAGVPNGERDDLTEELEDDMSGPEQANAAKGAWAGSEGDVSSVTSSNASSTLSMVKEVPTPLRRPEVLKLSVVEPEFKTPPRPTRSTSMPPTPPESGQGTPPQEASPPKVGAVVDQQMSGSASRSRRTKTPAELPARSTRSQTPGLESTGESKVEEEETADSPPRTLRSTRGGTPTRATTPPRTTRATTPPRTTRATTPPRTTRATTPPRTTRATTPPRTTRATSPPRTTRATTPPRTTRATTPPRTTRATSPPRTTRATTPTRTTRATTPQRTTKDTSTTTTPEATEPARPSTPTRTTRATTPQRLTRSQASSPVRKEPQEDVVMQEPVPKSPTRGKASKAALSAEPESLNTTRSTRSRLRTDSTSDAKSTTTIDDDHTDSISIASTSSRRSRGRPSSRSSSPVASAVSEVGNMTPPHNEEQETDETKSRTTRSGGRSKTTPTRRTPTRKSGRKNTVEVNSEDVEMALTGNAKREDGLGEGLLSSQSFMMAMRTRRSVSRETTPERRGVAMSDVSSTVTEDDLVDRTAFTFSEPMAVDSVKDGADEMTVQPISSFIFSPPITRTRARKPEIALKSKVKLKTLLPDATNPAKIINNAKKSTTRAKKAKSSTSTTHSDSPINFLSPGDVDDTEEDEPRRRVLQKKPMTLRPKRGSTKKKGTLKLW